MPDVQGDASIREDTLYLAADMTTVIDDDYFWVSLLQLIEATFQPCQNFPKFGIGLCLREPLKLPVC